MRVEPIKPSSVAIKKAEAIPDEVIAVFNELIAEKWDGAQAVIRIGEAAKRVREKLPQTQRGQVFDKGWLNVAEVYRKAGGP